MKQNQISNQSKEVFEEIELTLVCEVCYDQPQAVINDLCTPLSEAQRQMVRYLLAVYYDRMDDGVDSIKGGKDALYTDNQVNRIDVANRLRRLLTLPPLSAQQLADIADLVRAQRGIAETTAKRSQSVETSVVW